MKTLIGLGAFIVIGLTLGGLFTLGVKMGINRIHRKFHNTGKTVMERRYHVANDDNAPNRRFIDRYKPGGAKVARRVQE